MQPVIEDLSTVAAVGSFAAATWVALFSRRQVRSAEEQAAAARRQVDAAAVANYRADRSAQIQLVVHFAESYHKIRGPGLDFSNAEQAEQYWGLHYLEFFYFNQGDIPRSIYGLWMVELAAFFSDKPDAWISHEKYLQRFSGSFADMYTFFRGINEAAVRDKNMPPARDKAVLSWVSDWPGLRLAGDASLQRQA